MFNYNIEENISKIYDIMDSRLKETGKKMPVSRKAYAFFVHCQPREADYLQLERIDKESFQNAVCCTLLERPAEEGFESKFALLLGKSNPEKYKQNILMSIFLSEEFRIKGPILYNAFVLEPQKGINKIMHTIKAIAFRGVHHVPNVIKKKIKASIAKVLTE